MVPYLYVAKFALLVMFGLSAATFMFFWPLPDMLTELRLTFSLSSHSNFPLLWICGEQRINEPVNALLKDRMHVWGTQQPSSCSICASEPLTSWVHKEKNQVLFYFLRAETQVWGAFVHLKQLIGWDDMLINVWLNYDSLIIEPKYHMIQS